MQSIFFIFVFNPRWLKAREVKNEKSPIIFFDGLCVFCNSWVDFLLKEDYLHTFRFSPLQGKLARRLLPVKGLKDPQHLLLFIAKNEVYFGAEAVLWIASTLGACGVFWHGVAVSSPKAYGLSSMPLLLLAATATLGSARTALSPPMRKGSTSWSESSRKKSRIHRHPA